MQASGDRLSTTALARRLDVPVQQLFSTLRDYGWIQRADDSWSLTPKGEFEGGSYHSSRRYGSYIVWPETLLEHPLLQAIESNQRVTAASLCRHYPHLHPRQINRAFAELGLQQHTLMGWELTELGRSLGGFQEESSSSGAFYVTWPPEIAENPVVRRELGRQSQQLHPPTVEDDGVEPDLFAARENPVDPCRGVDGHQLQSPLQARVCNWLYMAQLAHAYQRALPTEEALFADFYVPVGNVYIDCWEADVPADELSPRLRKKELYGELNLRSLEINAADADRLDEVLGRGLLAFGIRY
jgi:hypothetical protein